MSNGDPDPICDLACQTKIVIDGGLTGKVFEETCYGIKSFLSAGGTFRDGSRVLAQLIKAENEAFKFMRIALEEMGYEGPWPHSLSFREHDDEP